MNENMTDIEPSINDGAIKVYQNDTTDEFPVLKAFQQYIDAEQAKARKRMILLCVFFSFVLTAVITVFVSLLLASSSRNQSLNDRLVEYAMRDRERAPVVTHPISASQDNAALQALAGKLDELQKSIADDRVRAEKAAAEVSVKSSKHPSVESLEIERLKALLTAEKEKAAAEREKLRQAELEEYRRKHYPELYGLKPDNNTSSSPAESRKRAQAAKQAEADREIEAIVNDIEPISYFDEEDEDDEAPSTKRTVSKQAAKKKNPVPTKDEVKTPNGVKDSSGTTWGIPEE